MNFLIYISNIIIPLTCAYIVCFGLSKKCNVFESFTEGAMDGIQTVAKLLPTLIGLLVAVNVFRASGLLDFICSSIDHFMNTIHIENFPEPLLPLAMVKMFSASAANGLLFDIFKEYGTDSFLGTAASIMMSSTETMLYCLSIYFGCVNIRKTRWAIPGSLLASVVGILSSIILAGLLLNT